jgi:hypothetical protein
MTFEAAEESVKLTMMDLVWWAELEDQDERMELRL